MFIPHITCSFYLGNEHIVLFRLSIATFNHSLRIAMFTWRDVTPPVLFGATSLLTGTESPRIRLLRVFSPRFSFVSTSLSCLHPFDLLCHPWTPLKGHAVTLFTQMRQVKAAQGSRRLPLSRPDLSRRFVPYLSVPGFYLAPPTTGIMFVLF